MPVGRGGVLWGRGGVLWAGAEERGRWKGCIIEAIIFGYLLCRRMTTSADRNDLLPAQEKLEWITPKISLMEAGITEGKLSLPPIENPLRLPGDTSTGPS